MKMCVPHAGLVAPARARDSHGGFAASDGGTVGAEDVTVEEAKLELGFSYAAPDGGNFSISAYSEGLGGNYSARGAELLWVITF